MDTQIVEILGRNKLIDELVRAGFEVATPVRDKGIDLIAYNDANPKFRAVPIQIKALSKGGFSIDKKYEKIPDLILTFIWNVDNEKEPATFYALTYSEALKIGEKSGWTKTPSWINGKKYTTTKPSPKLVKLLDEHKMTPEKWRKKLIEC